MPDQSNEPPYLDLEEYCSCCCHITNLVLCEPPTAVAEIGKEDNAMGRERGWIKLTIGHIQANAAQCRLCQVIFQHLSNTAPMLFKGDPARRVCLTMINERGYQSDGLQRGSTGDGSIDWRQSSVGLKPRDNSPKAAGVAAIAVAIEQIPTSSEWVPLIQSVCCAMRVYAPKTCSAEIDDIVMRREVDENASSSVQTVSRKWLDACVQGHWRCRRTISGTDIDDTRDDAVALPTRVIAISTDGWTLHKGRGQPGRYVALSYCRGPAADIEQFQLRKNNVTHFASKVHALDEAIPKIYRDAMILTQALGCQYLWIDALCIIQDDDSDWTREARAMASIYQNATVTIAALAGQSMHDSLFKRTTPSAVATIPWLKRTHGGELQRIGHVYTTADLPVEISLTHNARLGLSQEQDSSVWQTRGWTFQEAAVSRRVISLGRYSSYWECQTMASSEDGWDQRVVTELPKQKLQQRLGYADNALRHTVYEYGHILEDAGTKALPSSQDSREERSRKSRTRRILTVAKPIVKIAGSSQVLNINKRFQSGLQKLFPTLNTSEITDIRLYVADYTARALKVRSDRQIAFEGFARLLAQRSNQEYHSGIWTSSVAYCLYWCPSLRTASQELPPVAPSWSWASCPGQVWLAETETKTTNTGFIWYGGGNGHLSQITFLGTNIRMELLRGLRPESMKLDAYSIDAIRSQHHCVEYPQAQTYLNDTLRLELCSGHSRSWAKDEAYMLFVDDSGLGPHTKSSDPPRHCERCKQSLSASNEYRTISHIEECKGGTNEDLDVGTIPWKLYGVALFDNKANHPLKFKVLILSHARDYGTCYSRAKANHTTSNEPPALATAQPRAIVSPDEGVLGFGWVTQESGVREMYRQLAKPLQIYRLLLIQETDTSGQYVRVGIGVGYWLPDAAIFGGKQLNKTWSKSSLVLV